MGPKGIYMGSLIKLGEPSSKIVRVPEILALVEAWPLRYLQRLKNQRKVVPLLRLLTLWNNPKIVGSLIGGSTKLILKALTMATAA